MLGILWGSVYHYLGTATLTTSLPSFTRCYSEWVATCNAVAGTAQLAKEKSTGDCQAAFNDLVERTSVLALSYRLFIHPHPYSAYYSA